jgi:capsular polysaccharide biosynthesis protein
MGLLRRIFRKPDGPAWTERLPDTVTYRSPLKFARIAYSLLGEGRTGSWRSEPRAWRSMTRGGPSFHDAPDGTALFRDLGSTHVVQPPVFVAAMERAFLVGSRSFVTDDGVFFNDDAYKTPSALAHLRSTDPFLNEYSGLVATEDQGRFRLERGGRRIVHLPGPVVSLCSTEGGNYGSFLFRVLPKLATLKRGTGDWTVLTPPLWPTTRALLILAGVPEERIVVQQPDTIYAIDRAIVPSLRNPHALLDDATLTFYAGLRERGGMPGERRIFVSRTGWNERGMGERPMLNEDEVRGALEFVGFETVHPHAMTMPEQIACFASASMIVGPAGSAMFNTVFCRPGTKVIDIESEPHWIFTHCNLFGSCKLDYGIFEARAADSDWSEPHKPFSVNVPALMERIARL